MHSRRCADEVQRSGGPSADRIRAGMKRRFNRVVDWLIHALGSPPALGAAALVIVIWALTGPIFGFSDTWQLVINTSTTIITFLMVFVIQNAANRDAKAVHIKLDELITSIEGARNKVVLAESETEDEQDREIAELKEIASRMGGHEAAVKALTEAAEEAEEAEEEARQVAGGSRPSSRRKAPTARTSSRHRTTTKAG
jgi:low affinity Fe/Cu permease